MASINEDIVQFLSQQKTLKYFHPKVCPKATNKTEVKPKKEKIKVKEIEENRQNSKCFVLGY